MSTALRVSRSPAEWDRLSSPKVAAVRLLGSVPRTGSKLRVEDVPVGGLSPSELQRRAVLWRRSPRRSSLSPSLAEKQSGPRHDKGTHVKLFFTCILFYAFQGRLLVAPALMTPDSWW